MIPEQTASAETLREVYLFSTLEPAQLKQVVSSMREIELDPGQRLFDHGTPAQHFYLVKAGEIKLYRLSEDGDEKVIEIIRPGHTFAEAVMFMSAKAYPVNAEAITKTTLLAFENEVFFRILEKSVDSCFRLLGVMSQRLHRQLNEIDGITLHSATFRLVNYLLQELPADVHKSPQICLTTPKHIVASRLSIQPETFSRLMAKLANEGLVEIQGTTIILKDLPRLRELVESPSVTG